MLKGKINLILDKPYYIAGEIITGNCQLVLNEAVATGALDIKWKGMERTKFVIARQESHHNPQTGQTTFTTVYDKHEQEKTFFKSKLVLANFNGGTAQPGTYSYPFQFQLPADLPGGFNYHKSEFGNEYRGAIVYKVKCNLDNVHAKDIHDKRFLVVVPRSMTIPQQITEHNDKTFLFGGSGKLNLDVTIAKNVFVPGESVPVRAIVDNGSKKKVDKLKVKLMREVTVTCKGIPHTVLEEVNRNVFPGVEKKSKTDTVLSYVLPSGIYPSTAGSLMSCKYHLDIECDVAMAIDLEVHPKIEIIFMPANGQSINLYDNMPKGCWK